MTSPLSPIYSTENFWHGSGENGTGAKKGFGWDKICSVNNLKQPVRTKFHPCRTKIFTRAGTFDEVVPARVKMVRVLKKRHGSDGTSSVNT